MKSLLAAIFLFLFAVLISGAVIAQVRPPQPTCPAGTVFSCVKVGGFFSCGCR